MEQAINETAVLKGEMKINDILDVIRGLAQCQGFYGRLYRNLMEIKRDDKATWRKLVRELEKQKFKTPLDVVYFFEC